MTGLLYIPPAVRFLIPRLIRLAFPPLVVWALCHALGRPLHLTISTTWLSVLCVVSVPLTVFVSIAFSDFKKQLDARRLGATLPPSIEPRGLSLLNKIRGDVDESINNIREVDWVNEYGRIVNWRLYYVDTIIVTEPEYLKRIFVTDSASFEKGVDFISPASQMLGKGIFTSDGDTWRFYRTMTRPFFTKNRISQFEIFEQRADTVIDLIKSRGRDGLPINWQDIAYRFTIDCGTTFLFGHDVASLSESMPYPPGHAPAHARAAPDGAHDRARAFAESLQAGMVLSAMRTRYGRAWPLLELTGDRVRPHAAVVDAFLEPIIAAALQRRAESPTSPKDDVTLLEYLVTCTDDPKVIRDETMDMLLGSRDTIASTLTSSVLNLSRYPDICQRLRQEVLDTVGYRIPTYEEIHQMKYMTAFINEVLRLFPPVPINLRSSLKGMVWPPAVPGEKPIYIPPDTRIAVPVLILHRRADLWGPTAAQFDPDRFLDERLGRYLTPNPLIFMPFNVGPRICPGRQFAYTVTAFMLARLLQSFSAFAHVEYEPGPVGPGSVSFDSHLTFFIEGDLWIKMTEDLHDSVDHVV